MKKNKMQFNSLLLRYKKYVAKLERLLATNKNTHRQGVLKRHIKRLYKKLSSLDISIKQYSRATLLGLALMSGAFSAASQTSFKTEIRSPFNLNGDSYRNGAEFADMDNDGDQDILFRNPDFNNTNPIYRENIGSNMLPEFSVIQEIPVAIGVPAAADLDGDGDLDLISIGDDFLFAENSGDANTFTFGSVQTNPFNLNTEITAGYVLGEKRLTLADFDNDGDLDILSSSYSGGAHFYFKNIGDAQNPDFETAVFNPFGLNYTNQASIDAGDIDNDGDIDLIGVGIGWVYYENQGVPEQALFNAPQEMPFNLNNIYSIGSPDLVDIDGDGDLDVIYSAYEDYGYIQDIFFAENKCTDNGSAEIAFEGPYIDIYNINYGDSYFEANLSSDFVDIDDDGDLDLFTSGNLYTYYPSEVIFKENVGTATEPLFEDHPTAFGLNAVVAGANYNFVIDFADLDDDGDYDAIIGKENAEVFYFENIGSSSAPQFDVPQINPFNIISPVDAIFLAPTFVDYNDDGLIDLVVKGGNGVEELFFYENTGTPATPSFSFPQINLFNLTNTGSDFTKVEFCDLDMDGDLDMFAGQDYGVFAYYQNSGTASIPFYETPITNPFNLSFNPFRIPLVASGDLDNDGDIDLFVGAQSLDYSRYFRNYMINNDDPLDILTCGDVTIPLDYDGVTIIDPIDLLLFNPCSPDYPFDMITAEITQVDASDLGGPIPVEVSITIDGIKTICTSQMTVVDLLAPEIPPIPPTTQEANPGDDFVALPDYTPIADATDNSGMVIITQDPVAGTEIPVNTTITVLVRAADASGNETVRQAEFTALPLLGIADNALDSLLQLYPNPAENTIVLLNDSEELLQKIKFLDVTGKVVKEVSLLNTEQEIILDISPLATGIYMLKIETETASVIKKLIKR